MTQLLSQTNDESNQRCLTLKEKHLLTIICKLYFLNKGAELVNVSNIFHDLSVKTCLPTDIEFDDSNVVYSLTNPIRSIIFSL